MEVSQGPPPPGARKFTATKAMSRPSRGGRDNDEDKMLLDQVPTDAKHILCVYIYILSATQ